MTNEVKAEIESLFNNINRDLGRIEYLLRGYFHNPTYEYFAKKINIPSGLVREKLFFINAYKLTYIISSSDLRNAISFALIQADINAYLMNRINMWGIARTLFIKNALINLASIIEGIIIGTLQTAHSFCIRGNVICKFNSKCVFYVNSTKHMKFKQAIPLYFDKFKVDKDDVKDEVLELLNIRNNIHLTLLNQSEFGDQFYNNEKLKQAYDILVFLRDNQIEYINKFTEARKEGCLI